jgi:hypothetical protein
VAGARTVFAAEGRGFDTWTSAADLELLVEDHAPPGWFTSLARRGHPVRRVPGWQANFGHAHLVAVAAQGHLEGAADPRSISSSAAGR